MRKFVMVALAGAFALTGAAETIQPAAAETQPAPRSLDQVRQSALAAMHGGDLQNVQSVYDRSWQRGRGYRGRRHYRGDRGWRRSNRYYGGRSYYRDRGYYGRRHYGSRRYYGGRRYRPGIYFGIR